MKYCIRANLSFETPAKRDTLDTALKDKIAGKLVWGNLLIWSGINRDAKPSHGLEVRFDTEADMEELFAYIKDKIVTIPVLKGKVSKHNCDHDETVVHSCQIQEEFIQ